MGRVREFLTSVRHDAIVVVVTWGPLPFLLAQRRIVLGVDIAVTCGTCRLIQSQWLVEWHWVWWRLWHGTGGEGRMRARSKRLKTGMTGSETERRGNYDLAIPGK